MPYGCRVDASRVLAFAGVALLVILFPGPSVLFIVSRSLSLGRLPALVTVLGNQLGELLQVCAVAAGIGYLVTASDAAFTVIKLLGAGYLVYLGVRTIRHGRAPVGVTGQRPRISRRRVLAQAVTVGVTNPKTTVFFAAVLPQFVDTRLGHVPLQMLLLGVVWATIALISDSLWALAASRAGAWLTTSPRRFRRLQAGSGAVMVGLGISLALSGRATTT